MTAQCEYKVFWIDNLLDLFSFVLLLCFTFVCFLCSFRISGPIFRARIRIHKERVVTRKCKPTNLKRENV